MIKNYATKNDVPYHYGNAVYMKNDFMTLFYDNSLRRSIYNSL